MGCDGKMLCSYPGPAAALFAMEFHEEPFLNELTNFLYYMNRDAQEDAMAHTHKAKTVVAEERETADPKYITQVLTSIFMGKGYGKLEDVPRICKKISDDVLWNKAKLPWRRSQLWLVMRVAMQTTLRRVTGKDDLYKSFMVLLHTKILEESHNRQADGYLLFAIRAKTGRRAAKLGDNLLPFVSKLTLEVATRVQATLEKRWNEEQHLSSQSPDWKPAALDPESDTVLQLTRSLPRIRQALNRDRKIALPTPFTPKPERRLRDIGGFSNFNTDTLNTFFLTTPLASLIDFEEAARTQLDPWMAKNSTSSQAIDSLFESLITYHEHASKHYKGNPENISIMILTMFCIWVALDRVTITQCPLLKEYPPVAHAGVLHPLLLRKAEDIERVAAISEHLSRRKSEATFSEDVFRRSPSSSSFYARYYDTSSKLQKLKKRIEADATSKRDKKEL